MRDCPGAGPDDPKQRDGGLVGPGRSTSAYQTAGQEDPQKERLSSGQAGEGDGDGAGAGGDIVRGVGGVSSNSPSPTNWISILASILGGGIVGFFSSLLQEPAKKIFLRPRIQINFPIDKKTNLEDSKNTPFLNLLLSSLSVRDHKVIVRAKVENQSDYFLVEKCRVFLTKIEHRISYEEEWKQTDYNELNQIAWSEKSFEFEELDIYPNTERSFDIIEIISSPQIKIRTEKPHPSFSYLFPSRIPPKRELKLYFQVVGGNVRPKKFDVKISCIIDKGNNWTVFVNDCPIDFIALIRRGGYINSCFVCGGEYFSEGENQQHSDCTCPLCGEKCVSYRPPNDGSSFRIEHKSDLKTCTQVYIIDQTCLTNRAKFPIYKNFLENYKGDSIPEIRPPQIPM